jgi:hypothetical protein
MLYPELASLYCLILLQFVVHDYVGDKSGIDLLNVNFKLNEKQLDYKYIRIGIMNSILKYFFLF